MCDTGDHVRARRIARHMDSAPFEHVSQRGFTTLTGRYKGVPVSIIAIGMVGSRSHSHRRALFQKSLNVAEERRWLDDIHNRGTP